MYYLTRDVSRSNISLLLLLCKLQPDLSFFEPSPTPAAIGTPSAITTNASRIVRSIATHRMYQNRLSIPPAVRHTARCPLPPLLVAARQRPAALPRCRPSCLQERGQQGGRRLACGGRRHMRAAGQTAGGKAGDDGAPSHKKSLVL